MKLLVTVREAVAGMSLAYLPREAANSSLIEVCNHELRILPKMRDLESVTLIWRSLSWWGRLRVASAFASKGGEYLSHDYLQPMPALITQDARPKIVDALLMLISSMGQGALVYIFWSQRRPFYLEKHQHTIANIVRSTVGYLMATMNRTTRNANPEIGPDGSIQTRRNSPVDGHGAGFGPPSSSASGFWTVLEANRTAFPVQIWTAGRLPGPVANTA